MDVVTQQQIADLTDRVTALERRLAELEGAPATSGRGTPAGSPDADPEVLGLVARGRKIEAIRRYRELTGAGLAEAKDAVERLER